MSYATKEGVRIIDIEGAIVSAIGFGVEGEDGIVEMIVGFRGLFRGD